MLALCVLSLGGCAPDYADTYDDTVYTSSATRQSASAVRVASAHEIHPPRRTLLEPARRPDCEDPGGDTAPGDELAERIRLGYERECYKQAEESVRKRLLGLQAWTIETVKAASPPTGPEANAR